MGLLLWDEITCSMLLQVLHNAEVGIQDQIGWLMIDWEHYKGEGDTVSMGTNPQKGFIFQVHLVSRMCGVRKHSGGLIVQFEL